MYSTLMALQIPPRLLGTVVTLFKLPNYERQLLLDAMTETAPSIGMANYEAHLKVRFPNYASEWIANFVGFFLSFYNLTEVGSRPEKVAQDFVEALRSINNKDVKDAPEEKFEEFEAFAVQVLTAHSSLGMSAKATRLLFENERTFVHSDIFSDIRSVFSDSDVVEAPAAAIIIHSLKIHHQYSDEGKDFFVVMDYGDLIKLQETVVRAIDKHKALTRVLDKSGVHNVETGGFDE